MSACQKTLGASVALYVALAVSGAFVSPMFFYWDEWTWLKSLSENSPLVWILQKHLGHLYPLGRLMYFLEVILFEDGYRAYLLVNVLVHALNTVLLFHLARRFSRSEFASLLVSSLYLFTPVQNENVFWGMQVAVLAAVTALLISFACVAAWVDHGRRRHLAGAVAASCAAPFLFDLLLPAPFLALALYWGLSGGPLRLPTRNDARCLGVAVSLGVAQLAVVATWFALGTISSDQGNHPGAIDRTPLAHVLAAIGIRQARYVLFGIGALPLHFLGLISDSPPARSLIAVAVALSVFAVSPFRDRSGWATVVRVYAAMVAPLLLLLSLKRGYALDTSLTGRYLTVFYVPCALFWAQSLTVLIESSRSIFATDGRMLGAKVVRGVLAALAVASIASQLMEHASFFRGQSRRRALANAIPRQRAAALALPRFYALTDDASTSRRLLEELSSPELTEAEALKIRRLLFHR